MAASNNIPRDPRGHGHRSSAPITMTLTRGKLTLLLATAFLLGASMCGTFFIHWSYLSDPILVNPRYRLNNGMPIVDHTVRKTEAKAGDLPVTVAKKAQITDSNSNINRSNNLSPSSNKSSTISSCPASGSIKCCQSSIQNPPDKIDIVIPYEYRGVKDISLQYELRSFEKHGLLDHVGTVFMITEHATDASLMEEQYRSYMNKTKHITEHTADDTTTKTKNNVQLRIIAMDDIQVPFPTKKFKMNVKLAKSHYSPFLPGISEYYLLVPDDIVMLKEYSRDVWFDAQKKLPHGHGFGTWRGGATHGYPNLAELHGVNFLNRCAMQYAIEKYHVDKPEDLSPAAVAIGMMNREHLLAGFYGYSSNGFAKVGPHRARFFKECHTNGGCKIPPKNGDFGTIFVNIQGQGVSVEYLGSSQQEKTWSDWFKTTFPLPSRFE